jgi:hypothetical protein
MTRFLTLSLAGLAALVACGGGDDGPAGRPRLAAATGANLSGS